MMDMIVNLEKNLKFRFDFDYLKMNSVTRKDGTKEKQPELTASKIHQISPVDVIKSDQKENNESFENKETAKKSSWDSSPLVPEVDEIPF